ncbi:MAG TPA: flagellar hook protein FlgE [Ideonella sp.]|uniref:flagellar hook protein FlgE n=1 Tax=Ideonella sp. TaxID=1929293 RepID=UPI002E3026A8|nr:flagellar hook protein FlgE [Ideonella sp.]HEX5685332.1 flagellar hook protein FlgE [Ideonella sp.]
MSFQQGLSGLNTTSKSLEVIGNNIANANTFGAKGSRAEFSDMYAAALNGAGTNNIGIGVSLAAVSQQFTQGSITATENPMDLALNGGGFFQLSDTSGSTVYSRNGQFKVDQNGFIVNNASMKLMGYMADNNGVIQPGAAVPLRLPTAGIEPNVTSEVNLEFNLDKSEGITPAATPLIDFDDPSTYAEATEATVYDAAGQPVTVSYYFQKTADDTWNVFARANGTSCAGTDADPQPVTTLTFSADGSTFTSSNDTLDIPTTVDADGVSTLAIPGVELDFTGSTQYGAAFGVTNLDQDGYSAGSLSGITFDSSGVVMARYTNGQTKPAGQLQLANFRNPQGLQPLGGNGWRTTYASGDPLVGTPSSGSFGALQAGALEESNVDLTGELVSMITAQRNYQANAQTIKTMDQVMQTLVNLR